MENKTKYWKGLEELNRDPEFVQTNKNEFAEGLPLDEVFSESNMNLSSNRRDFLKFFGFSISAVALASCNTAPIKNVVPYVTKPEEITPGNPNWYASTYGSLPVLVKTREGRPIKIEGNDKAVGFSNGRTDAVAQASILSLYDTERLDVPTRDGKPSNWQTIDKEISDKLAATPGAGIRIVSATVNSPSMLAAIGDFTTKYAGAQHVTYDALSYSGIINANKMCYNKAVLPSYRFDNAKVIVSFGADFLGTWISPVEFSQQWVKNRTLYNGEKEISRHYQFESIMSLTGSNADMRMTLKPSQQADYVINLYNAIASKAGKDAVASGKKELGGNMIAKAADDLWKNKGQSLVVCGSNDANVQCLINGINEMLGNIGTTVDLDNYSHQYKGTDEAFENFVNELNAGTVKAVIFYGVNPAYTYYNKKKIEDGLKKAELSISLAGCMDETARLCKYVAPDNHYLESWGDTQLKEKLYSFCQPTINKVFDTRQAMESILTWSGNNATAYDYIKNTWQTKMGYSSAMWNESLQNGVVNMAGKSAVTVAPATSDSTANHTAMPAAPAGTSHTSMANMAEMASKAMAANKTAGNAIEFVAYESVALRDGSDANNPWLQELPDPISKVTWDNYASISKYNADMWKVNEGDTLSLTVNGLKLENMPIVIQPGQARDTIAVAIGYGRKGVGKVAEEAGGFDVYPARSYSNGAYICHATATDVKPGSKSYELARTQTHHSIEGRDLVKEATIGGYQKDPHVGNHNHHDLIKDPKKNGSLYTLWEEHDTKGHKWAMAIDLNACTGCGACIVSCNAENNVPVVGRTEIRRRREMHWLRIDRYYRFSPSTPNPDDKQLGAGFTKSGDIGLASPGYNAHPEYFDEVSVAHVPMLCQHCGHAPCETVCPVLATTHSSEGLNQMTYNRCIGTKYCANNCPYKVRRFNWFRYNDNDKFDYYMNNDLGKMVINPDVTVRTRGVMEKCSFCIQRIQYGKLQAKLQNRAVKDGDIKTACQQTCPTNAIVFGDLKDPKSEISRLQNNARAYHMLEELNVQPSIYYMTKIRNVEEVAAATHAAAPHTNEKEHAH